VIGSAARSVVRSFRAIFPSSLQGAIVLGIGLKEVIVIGIVVLLLFGGSILPRLARSGAKRVKDSKGTLLETKAELEAGLKDLHGDDTAAPAPTTAPNPAPQNRAPSR
jgi:Sec-independent protein translocase protein TatA